jgi:DNA-binding HxlR family transcriptional regulator
MKKKDLPPRRSGCTISYALDYIGDKWTLLVLRDLLFQRKRRFGDFLTSEEGIASNILSQRLRRLEAAEMVTRRPDPENGRSVLYEPTQKAADLIPALLELSRWSGKYDPQTKMSAKMAKRLEEDREGLLAEAMGQAMKR